MGCFKFVYRQCKQVIEAQNRYNRYEIPGVAKSWWIFIYLGPCCCRWCPNVIVCLVLSRLSCIENHAFKVTNRSLHYLPLPLFESSGSGQRAVVGSRCVILTLISLPKSKSSTRPHLIRSYFGARLKFLLSFLLLSLWILFVLLYYFFSSCYFSYSYVRQGMFYIKFSTWYNFKMFLGFMQTSSPTFLISRFLQIITVVRPRTVMQT